jgi:hypothetical protein
LNSPTLPKNQPESRVDEGYFKRAIPDTIGGFRVVEVGGYRQGHKPGTYANAVALMHARRPDVTEYNVCVIYLQDDQGVPDYFVMGSGRYTTDIERAVTIWKAEVSSRNPE